MIKFMISLIFSLFLLVPNSAFALDHSAFFNEQFEDGPTVTATCLTCHEKEGQDVLKSAHWNWNGPSQDVIGHENRTDLGKSIGFNNFCISIPSNETRCTSCHIGYGWKDESFDFNDPGNIDCLVCHETTGDYKKAPPAAGHVADGVDLLKAAQSVAMPERANCGSCHFYGGGGDAVKQGDLDSTMVNPSREHDVHMGGLDMSCQDCHTTVDHKISGGSVHVIPTDAGRVSCESCHDEPHSNSPAEVGQILEQHTDAVACQTCHIPTFSKELPTKMHWDWSTAGEDRESPLDEYGMKTYDKKKGDFIWEKNVTPVYAWYNGKTERYVEGDQFNTDGLTSLATPVGDINDAEAKIYPFKVHTGSQPGDSEFGYLLYPNTFGGFWSYYDWDSALATGAEASGLAFSGNYQFVETDMYVAINHEVVPKEMALGCFDCHSENGVLDFKALGYEGDPMQTGARFVSNQSTSDQSEPDSATSAPSNQKDNQEETTNSTGIDFYTIIIVLLLLGVIAGFIVARQKSA